MIYHNKFNKNNDLIDSINKVCNVCSTHELSKEILEEEIIKHIKNHLSLVEVSDFIGLKRKEVIKIIYKNNLQKKLLTDSIKESEIEKDLISLSNLSIDKYFSCNRRSYFYNVTGIKLVDNQVNTCFGTIDLLGKDKKDNRVVIELKNKVATHRVIGQVLKYLNNLNEKAIVIAPGFNKSYFYALKHFNNIKSYIYDYRSIRWKLTEVNQGVCCYE
jgi:ABC-type antimicrobial peptide transport system permease subunit